MGSASCLNINKKKNMKACIFQNKVVDKKETEFPVSEEMFWVDCEDSVPIGWGYSNGSFHDPDTRTDEEKAKHELLLLRRKRNILLNRSDWSHMADNNLSNTKKTEWANYRQSLRDITKSFVSIKDVGFTWPDEPT